MQMIGLRMRFNTSINRADAKISLLKEVIERVQKGEEVNVEGLLGRGDPQQELEWADVLREAENDSELFKKSGKKAAMVEEAPSPKPSPVQEPTEASTKARNPPKANAPAVFY